MVGPNGDASRGLPHVEKFEKVQTPGGIKHGSTLDTSQNLTWLDLSVSAGWSTSNWASNVAPGAGWRLATNDEVLNLLIDAFPSIGAPDLVNSQTYNSSSVLADIAGFTALFGRTWPNTRTYGFYQDEDALWRMAGVDDFGTNRTLWGGEFSVNYNAQAAAGNSVFGMYIVKAADVPEPASLALVGLALAGLGWQRRKAR